MCKAVNERSYWLVEMNIEKTLLPSALSFLVLNLVEKAVLHCAELYKSTLRNRQLITSNAGNLKGKSWKLIFSFITLNLVKMVKKDKKDFHITTVTVDLCMKEVKLILRRALWRKIMDTLKAKILTNIVLNLVRTDLSFYYTAVFRGPSMT